MTHRFTNRNVIPSYLGSSRMGGTETSSMHGGTVQLMLGEVKEVIPVDDQRSMSKRYLEYNVDVHYRDGHGPTSVVRFANCLLISNFGGGEADKTEYRLRSDDSTPQGDDSTTKGAKVLLLCIQGDANQAFIIGGVREDTKNKDVNDHHYSFEFNGAKIDINKDGEFQLRYRGATKVDGDLTDDADADAEGSTLIFNKEGGIKIYTKDEKQIVFVDHKNKKIDMLADEEWHVKINKKVHFEAGDQYTIEGQKGMDIQTSNDITMKSSGVKVGDATDSWMLGSTYRQAEGMMNQQISGYMNSLASLISTAATALQTASGMMKVPIAGPIAASVPIQAAAVALNSAGPLLGQVGSAISQFEGNASSYLSKKNKND